MSSDNHLINTIQPRSPKPKSHWFNLFLVVVGIVILLVIFGSQYASGEFGLSVSMENENVIDSKESIIISFNHPMIPKAVESGLKISPKEEVNLIWSENYRRLEIKPVKHFSPGTKYYVEIKPQMTFSFSRIFSQEPNIFNFSFQIEDLPKVISISPVSGDPNVKIDSSVKIIFDKSTRGYDVNFIVSPFSGFDHTFDSERKEFTLLPKENFKHGTDYAVSVTEAVSVANTSNEKNMPEIFRANFKTEAEQVVVPDPKPNEVASDKPDETIKARIIEGKYIDINLSKQTLSYFENGNNLGTFKVSSGKKGMATPTGTFKVMSKAGRAYSKKYNLYMPYWMQFTGAGHGIHELPEWKSGYKEGANHLGIPVSHGCVRLGVGPAKIVYNWAEIGTPIVTHY